MVELEQASRSVVVSGSSIEVDIAAEDGSAEFGKCTIIHLHFASSHIFCISIMLPSTSSLLFT